MNNHLSWPPLRTDVMGLVCVCIAMTSLIVGRWPGFAAMALAGAIFCAVSPRMKGPFGFQGGGGTQIGGTFDDYTNPPVVFEGVKPEESESSSQ